MRKLFMLTIILGIFLTLGTAVFADDRLSVEDKPYDVVFEELNVVDTTQKEWLIEMSDNFNDYILENNIDFVTNETISEFINTGIGNGTINTTTDDTILLQEFLITNNIVWEKTFSGGKDYKSSMSLTYSLANLGEKYLNIYIKNEGNVKINVNVLDNDPAWGSETYGNASVAPGDTYLLKIKAEDLSHSTESNNLVHASLKVYINDLMLENNIAFYGIARFYQ